MTVAIEAGIPEVSDYQRLASAVGWSKRRRRHLRTVLQNSLHAVTAREGETLVGFARVSGDGDRYYYLQDVMVRPDRQGAGIGSAMVEQLLEWIAANVRHVATISLVAAPGREDFYRTWGFRPVTGSHGLMERTVSPETGPPSAWRGPQRQLENFHIRP